MVVYFQTAIGLEPWTRTNHVLFFLHRIRIVYMPAPAARNPRRPEGLVKQRKWNAVLNVLSSVITEEVKFRHGTVSFAEHSTSCSASSSSSTARPHAPPPRRSKGRLANWCVGGRASSSIAQHGVGGDGNSWSTRGSWVVWLDGQRTWFSAGVD